MTIAPLGFEIDTKSLEAGRLSAEQLKAALLGLADATDKHNITSRNALDAQRREAEALDQAAAAARRKAAADAAAKAAAEKHNDTSAKTYAAQRKEADALNAAHDAAVKKAKATKALQDILHKTGGTVQTVGSHVQGLQQQLLNAGGAMTSPQGMIGGMNGMLSSATRMLPVLGATAGGLGKVAVGAGAAAVGYAALMAATVKQQEEFMILEARLKNVYGSAAAAAEMFREITDLANQNGLAIGQTADSFLRLARNNEAIGLTRNQMVELTDAVQKLGRVSGATNGELSSGLLQFSQALAAGKLNGDELRSIMENMPALAKAIADGMGVSVGQMRAMGAEGQLTSDKITKALLGQLPKIEKEFAGLPDTTAQAFQRVANSWDQLLAGMGERLNSSGILTDLGNGVASIMAQAAQAVAPETSAAEMKRLYEQRNLAAEADEALIQMDANGRHMRRSKNEPRLSAAQIAQENDLRRQRNSARAVARQTFTDDDKNRLMGLSESDTMMRRAMQRQEELTTIRAPFVRSGAVVTDLADTETKIKKLTESIKTMEDAYKSFTERPEAFPAAEAEKLAKYPDYIAAQKYQLEETIPVLDDYNRSTKRMIEDAARFGLGGAASLGEEARKLRLSAAGKGEYVSGEDALDAVTSRRVQDVISQTGAMDGQIAAQRRLVDAIGMGTEAQIEAEIATEAYNMQMRLFGENLGPDAAAAMGDYVDQLRQLKQAQADVTEGQRLFNATLELAQTQEISAAIARGASPGEVEQIKRNQSTERKRLEHKGPGIPEAYRPAFEAASRETGIPIGLLASVAKTESGFNPKAVSNTGARGIMQVLPSTARDPGYGVKGVNPDAMWNPYENIMFGARYLKGRGDKVGVTDWSDEAQVRKVLRQYSGADTATGDKAYDRKVLGHMGAFPADAPLANRPAPAAPRYDQADAAITIEGQTADLVARQQAQQRILELDRQAAQTAERSRASSPLERRQIEVRQGAEDSARSYAPDMQGAIVEREVLKARAEDDDKFSQRMQLIAADTQASKQRMEYARLIGKERSLEEQVTQEVVALAQMGLDIDTERLAVIRAQVEGRLNQQKAEEDANKLTEIYEGAAKGIGNALETSVSQAMENGKIEADEILQELLADITMSIMNKFVTAPLTDAIGTWIGSFTASAHGNAFAGGHRLAFAHGGLHDRPTLFPMAHGAGLMGEAGPEAVLPLKRGSDGRLGVGAGASGGGNTTIVVNDMRSASGAQPVETEETTGPDGQRLISILVRDEVRRQVKNGELDNEMRGTYGVTRQITRR